MYNERLAILKTHEWCIICVSVKVAPVQFTMRYQSRSPRRPGRDQVPGTLYTSVLAANQCQV